jgi:hypothetical protein
MFSTEQNHFYSSERHRIGKPAARKLESALDVQDLRAQSRGVRSDAKPHLPGPGSAKKQFPISHCARKELQHIIA